MNMLKPQEIHFPLGAGPDPLLSHLTENEELMAVFLWVLEGQSRKGSQAH